MIYNYSVNKLNLGEEITHIYSEVYEFAHAMLTQSDLQITCYSNKAGLSQIQSVLF